MPGPPASRVSFAVKASASAAGKPPKIRKNAATHPPFMFRLNLTPILYFEQLARIFNRTMFRLKIIADEQKSKRETNHRLTRTLLADMPSPPQSTWPPRKEGFKLISESRSQKCRNH